MAWLAPGGGYLLIGQRARGLTVMFTVLSMFLAGLFIGGVRVVDIPSDDPAAAGAAKSDRGGRAFVQQLLSQRPWFIGQVLAGPISFVPVMVRMRVPPAELTMRLPVSHLRMNEIGTLYTAVAGMLNLLTIIDSAYRAGHDND